MKRALIPSCALLATVSLAGAEGCGSDGSQFSDGDGGGSSSGGSSGSIFGNSDASNVGVDGGLAACATTSKKTEKIPLDMVIGLDTSFSMDFDSKWTNVKSALEVFVHNPAYADLGVGLQFFPIRKLCSVASYGTLAVNLGLLPDVATPITQALEAQQMADGTPMVPLLQGLTTYLRANARPGRKPVIVLATDGVPDNTCLGSVNGETPNTLDNAVAVAGQALAGTPSIPIFVIGVGKELSALNGIAAAGGTTAATLVDTGAGGQQAFLAALDAARKQAIPCDFAIPAGTNVDPNMTNVTYTPSGGAPQPFGYVGDAVGCARAPDSGWYFDNPTTPTKVILCNGACSLVKADDRGEVDVVFGCPRNEVR